MRKQPRSTHKIEKELRRELKHKDWLEKNLTTTEILRNSKKKILKLRTELAYKQNN